MIIQILAKYNLKIDGIRQGVAKFRDLEIGIGASHDVLNQVRSELIASGLSDNMMRITNVSNPEHPQFRKPYLEIVSFWWEE